MQSDTMTYRMPDAVQNVMFIEFDMKPFLKLFM